VRKAYILLRLGGKEYPPQIHHQRKKSERTNGLLAVELFSGDCVFQATKIARSEEIAQYFADLARNYEERGLEKIDIFLDRNPTHKAKMQSLFASLTEDLTIKTTFRLMASYSPKLNLVEYAIHLIRQKVLHHADCKTCLAEFESYIKELCDNKKILSKEQIINILQHIESLVC
jgi:DDE superfamily endonuclease